MKKQLFIIFYLIVFSLVIQPALFGQENKEEEKKKQHEEQLKQVEKARERAEELYKQRIISAETREQELAEISERLADRYLEIEDGVNWVIANPDNNVVLTRGYGQSETLEFRKTVTESSFKRTVPFNIEEGSKRVSITVSGSCKEGEIRIKIQMPGGNTYTEVLLDEFGSVNWNKSFSIDEEDKSRIGDWEFAVSAVKATGTFRIAVRSY